MSTNPEAHLWWKFSDNYTAAYYKLDHKVVYVQAKTETAAVARFERVTGCDPWVTHCRCCASRDFHWERLEGTPYGEYRPQGLLIFVDDSTEVL